MKGEWHGGKGSQRRGSDDSSYADNWEKVFGKPKPVVKARKATRARVSQIHKDRTKQIPRKHKYNHIEDSI